VVASLTPSPLHFNDASTFTYYLVGTDEQAKLLDQMDPHSSAFVIRSRNDEAIAESVISDDSRQISATGGWNLSVQDLRLTATPEPRAGTIIPIASTSETTGAPFEPGYADGVTYFIVESSAQAALLDATLQQLAGTSGPLSRYVVTADHRYAGGKNRFCGYRDASRRRGPQQLRRRR
jgi:hypothetical protein